MNSRARQRTLPFIVLLASLTSACSDTLGSTGSSSNSLPPLTQAPPGTSTPPSATTPGTSSTTNQPTTTTNNTTTTTNNPTTTTSTSTATWLFARHTVAGAIFTGTAFGYYFKDDIQGAPPGAAISWAATYSDQNGNPNPYPASGTYSGVVGTDGSYHYDSPAPVNCASMVACQYTITISIAGAGSKTVNFSMSFNYNNWIWQTSSPSNSVTATNSTTTFTATGSDGANWTSAIYGALPGAQVSYILVSYTDNSGNKQPAVGTGGTIGTVAANGSIGWGGAVKCLAGPPCTYTWTVTVAGFGSRTIAVTLK